MLATILAFAAAIVFLIYSTRGKSPRQNMEEEIAGSELTDADKELRQRIDLHYGRQDFSGNKDYVEFSFNAPFGEVFNIAWLNPSPAINGDELFGILDVLHIPYDKELIFDQYQDDANNSVEVFHSTGDEQVFAYFDLQKDPTDQIGMFFFGLSCKLENEKMIHEMLLAIYRKLQTASAFSFDRLNHPLYDKTFRSYSYFYVGNYDENKVQLNHHNLSPNG